MIHFVWLGRKYWKQISFFKRQWIPLKFTLYYFLLIHWSPFIYYILFSFLFLLIFNDGRHVSHPAWQLFSNFSSLVECEFLTVVYFLPRSIFVTWTSTLPIRQVVVRIAQFQIDTQNREIVRLIFECWMENGHINVLGIL